MKRLKCKVLDSPDVIHMLVGDLLELLDVVQELVHVADAFIKDHFRVVHYNSYQLRNLHWGK